MGYLFVCREITGAEYSKASSDGHTAGYSIRFPRITAERGDKTADDATTMGVCPCGWLL